MTNHQSQISPCQSAIPTRHTLKMPFEHSGVGLHSGNVANVRVLPAQAGEGRYFVRVDLPGEPIIPAQVDAVYETTLSTELRTPTSSVNSSPTQNARVRTVEHLLAALAGSGVDDARIEIDGAEVPLLDGSARIWVDAILDAEVVVNDGLEKLQSINSNLPPSAWLVQEPIWVHQGDAFVAALPASITRFTYGIDFDLPAIGQQWHSWILGEDFAEAIAPARTFGLAHQIEQLRQAGLIKGGSLENALVCDDSGWLNPPLRFSNEPARHKLLDLVGDLSLLGTFPVAHFLAYKASHNLHIQLAKKLAQQIG